jgi:hypothetical protein
VNVTASTLQKQRYNLPRTWRAAIRAVAAAPGTPHVDYYLLLAIMSRETNMQNIVGDAGHGRGAWQMDDRWQEEFLRRTPGCKPGSSRPRWPSCYQKGRVPMISSGARRCANMIEAGVTEAGREGVPFGHRLKVAISGYNAGMTGAIHAYKTTGNSDTATTGGNYAQDVLGRAAALRRG